MELQNKHAIVTGSGHGIGREIALLLAANGASVTIGDIDLERAQAVAKEIEIKGGNSQAVGVDVSIGSQVDNLISKAFNDFGTLDILVNNVGIGLHYSMVDTTEDDWDHVHAVNLKGPFLCSREAAKIMIQQGKGGRIINIGSTAADNARVDAAAYCASKAGVLQLTKVMALELGQYDITANAVCPGLTDYETSLNTAPPNYRKAFLSQVSMGRTGHASEIAEAVLFLASSRASFINGEVLHVDGGYSAGKPNVSRHAT